MLNMNKFTIATVLLGTALVSMIQFAATPTWAADCAKALDAKLSVCAKATANPGAGSQMQTVPQASAAEQKKATQAMIDSRTATSPQRQMHEKRNWVGKTVLDCKKGSTTLHMADATTPCPVGFKKS